MHWRNATWPRFRHVEAQAGHMDVIMRQLGVDVPSAVRHSGGKAFLSARYACANCHSSSRCREWSVNRQPQDCPMEFCPNAEFFRCFMPEASKDLPDGWHDSGK